MIAQKPSLFQPKTKPLRLPRSKAVTIAIGLICRDGLVLCADQAVGNESYKFHECKLSSIRLAGNKGVVILAYAGVRDEMNLIYEKLRPSLEVQCTTCEQIQLHIQDVLNSALPKTSQYPHQMLCGVSDGVTLRLFKTIGRNIYPIPVWDCIGFGDTSVIRYLGALFLKYGEDLPFFRAIPICNYMIAQAKEHIQFCGGPTDLWALTRKGKLSKQSSLIPLDCANDLVEKSLIAILTAATEPTTTAESCERLLRNLRQVIDASTQTYQTFLDG